MKVLMVCLGNICRSPMAQGVLEQKLNERGLSWKVDSAGTNGYHNGESPDPRAIKCAATHGIDISNQISRKITPDDFLDADLICVMDDMNYHTVTKLAPPYCRDKVYLLMDFVPDPPFSFVPDPYYDNSFERSYELINLACEALLTKYNVSVKELEF